ncbi:MAG: amidohydrolase [Gemmatimonadetes bacterium]|nr:amidohydrolase [Gemmatimonadota bacterium]
MRIDGHTHIFNLQTVLTPHAIEVMVNRIRERKLPDFVADALETMMVEQLERPEHLTEDELLSRFLDRMAQTKTFKQFMKKTTGLPVEIRLFGEGLRVVELAAMRSVLDRLSAWFDQGADSDTTIADIYDTLRIGMLPDITAVTDRLLAGMEPEGAIVALMMDITSEETASLDRNRFLAQMRGTRDAAVARPGRVLPFVAVNTRRPDHFMLMRQAIEAHGFVGVKLYPALGVPVDSDAMERVYDYCIEHDVPILLHCSRGGFYESEATRDFGNPALWAEVLEARPGLRVCFAHAGGLGQGILSPGGPKPPQWPHTIIELMLAFEHVYTDLAYHADQMVGGDAEARYLGWLRGLLGDPVLGHRVIWGSDFWLVRLSLDLPHYRNWFTSRLTSAELTRVMEVTPRRFLGLPDANGQGMRANIGRLVDFLRSQPAVGDEPPAWLRTAAAGASFTVRRTNPLWSPNHHAHFLTWRFFQRFMTPAQKQLDFAGAGPLRLRQLSYWNKEHVSPATFRKDCRAVAIALGSLARTSGGMFEGSHDDASAVDRLAATVADGEKTIADAAATVDAIFRFATEVV